MFLNRLTDAQQGVLLSLATRLMTADGKQLPEEMALLDGLRRQMASTVSPVEATHGDLPALFVTRPARVALVLELLGMALVDSEYHVTEQAFITAIADMFAITASELSDMESWVHRQFALAREAEQFMGA